MQWSCVIVGGAGEPQNSSYASAAAVSDGTLLYCDQDVASQAQSFISSIHLALLLKWWNDDCDDVGASRATNLTAHYRGT